MEEGVPLEIRVAEGGWRRAVAQRLPIISWARTYERTAALADLVAGVTLGLTLVPQSIAYASLANLPVQYGLYSGYIGTMLYVIFGTVKEVSIGPTSLMALFTLQICNGLPIEFVPLLAFLSGCIVFLMGILRLGFLVELISPSVTSGFTSATAVIIVVSQIKGLLGLSFVAESVYENFELIAANIKKVRLGDSMLALTCCVVLLSLRKLKDLRISEKRRSLKKAVWLISIGRNALVVLTTSVAAYCLHDPTQPLFKLSGRVEAGVPRISLPQFSITLNGTELDFFQTTAQFGSGLFMLPIVMVLANIAIAKAFSSGQHVDATQEMLTLGLCNVAGSLLHAMPTCGAFTRSAVSHSSGVRTPLAGLYSGVITLLALMFLTEYFYFIPKACLSSVLICAVIFMVDISTVITLWRVDRAELCVLLVTFAVSVARTVEVAVLVGVLANLALLLRNFLRPQIDAFTLKSGGGGAAVVRPWLCVCYLNCELVYRRVVAAAAVAPRPPLLLDLQHVPLLDHTAVQMIERLANKLKEMDKKLIVFRACEKVAQRLEKIDAIPTRALRANTALEALEALDPATLDRTGEDVALLTKEDEANNV